MINRIIFSNIIILKYIQYTNSNNVDEEDVSMHEDTPTVDNKHVNNNKDDNNDKTDSIDEDSSLSSLKIQSPFEYANNNIDFSLSSIKFKTNNDSNTNDSETMLLHLLSTNNTLNARYIYFHFLNNTIL